MWAGKTKARPLTATKAPAKPGGISAVLARGFPRASGEPKARPLTEEPDGDRMSGRMMLNSNLLKPTKDAAQMIVKYG